MTNQVNYFLVYTTVQQLTTMIYDKMFKKLQKEKINLNFVFKLFKHIFVFNIKKNDEKFKRRNPKIIYRCYESKR